MKKYSILIIFLLHGCSTYQDPKEGNLVKIKMMSNAHYVNILVEYCQSKLCEKPKKIGMLAGLGFMETDSIDKEKGDLKKRFVKEIKILANTASYIRFTTVKTILILGDEPKRRMTTSWALGMTITETTISYVKEKKDMKCEALVKIIPEANSAFLILHDHDEITEQCSARVEKQETS